MKHILYKSILLFHLVIGSSYAYCQAIIDQAWVEDDRLVIEFGETVVTTNGEGFRLVGGAARIQALAYGSGSTQLVFSLTDHVLPDDRFTLLYWADLGDTRFASQRLADQSNIPVINRADEYRGEGTVYYVSTAGRDAYYGTTPDHPLRTVAQAQQLAQPGDYVLLRRGDVFRDTFIDIRKSGQADRYLTIGAYGQGKKPVIEHDWKDIITVADQNYVLIDNLHLRVRGDGEKGIYLMGNCRYPVVSNCRVEGLGNPHFGINYGKNDGADGTVVYPRVLNNEVSGFLWNISSNGYPYDGTHEVRGGLIENNVSGQTRSVENADGIGAQRGKFYGLIIRKNEVYGYYDDGIDLFAADSVTVEYNTIHTPQQPAKSGQGIKAGGMTRTENINGHQSAHVTIRYNTIHNLYNRVNDQGSHNGIQTNDGASGEIYGNLVYNVRGNGIVVSGPIERWEIHHNAVVNAGEAGLNVWTEGQRDHQVAIYHNILEGNQYDIKVNTRTTGETVVGANNLLARIRVAGHYRGKGDRQTSPATVFVDPVNGNFDLKPTYNEYLGVGFPRQYNRE